VYFITINYSNNPVFTGFFTVQNVTNTVINFYDTINQQANIYVNNGLDGEDSIFDTSNNVFSGGGTNVTYIPFFYDLVNGASFFNLYFSGTYNVDALDINGNVIQTIQCDNFVITNYNNYRNFLNINVNTGVWTHLVWNIYGYAGNPVQHDFFINGGLVASQYNQNYPNTISRSYNFIGKSASGNNSDPYFNGEVDEFRMYNRPLGGTEITALYNYPYNTPVLSNALITNINSNSVTMIVVGSFNMISLYRNNVFIANFSQSPYIDYYNVLEGQIYNYNLVPYNVFSLSGQSMPLSASTTQAGNGYNIVDNNGLVLYYPYDIYSTAANNVANYSTGVPVIDSLVIGNAAIGSNTLKVGTGSLQITDAFSYINITGTALTVNYSTTAAPPFTINTADGFTISLWMNITTSTNNGTLFGFGDGSANFFGIELSGNNLSGFNVIVNNNIFNVPFSLSLNKWYFLIWNYNNTTQITTTNIVINNIYYFQDTGIILQYPTTIIHPFNYIGSGPNTTSFIGFIDDFRLYNRTLNSDEFYALYTFNTFNTNTYNSINGAYSTTITTNSVSMYFYGSYNFATITRNGTILTTNATSPYTDISGLIAGTNYQYSITGYDLYGNPSNNVQQLNLYTQTVGSFYNIVDASGLINYYPFDTLTYNNTQLYNYSTGVGINDASLSQIGIINTNASIMANGALSLSRSNYVSLPNINLGNNGSTISLWFNTPSTNTNMTLFSLDCKGYNTPKMTYNYSKIISATPIGDGNYFTDLVLNVTYTSQNRNMVGKYIVSASSVQSGQLLSSNPAGTSNSWPHYAFNAGYNQGYFSTNYYWASDAFWNYASGKNNKTATNYGILTGEWLQIQLPYNLMITGYNLYSTSYQPSTFYIVASNDGNQWYVVDSRFNITSWPNNNVTFTSLTVNPMTINPAGFNYYRIVISNALNNAYVYIWQFNISGQIVTPTVSTIDNNVNFTLTSQNKLSIQSGFNTITTNTTIIPNTWYNALVTIGSDGSVGTYINGTLDTFKPAGFELPLNVTRTNCIIGCGTYTTNILSQLYNSSQIIPNTNSLTSILYYPFDVDILNYASGIGIQNGSIIYKSSGIAVSAAISNTTFNIGTGALSSAGNSGSTLYSYFVIDTIPANKFGYSFSFWFYLNDNTAGMIYTFSQSSNTNNRVYVFFDGTYINIGTTTGINIFQPTIAKWYHFTWILRTYGVVTVYINGVNTRSYGMPYISYVFDYNFMLGDQYTIGTTNGINGSIDDFRYFDGILTDNNVLTLYNYNYTATSNYYTGLLDEFRVYQRVLTLSEIQNIMTINLNSPSINYQPQITNFYANSNANNVAVLYFAGTYNTATLLSNGFVVTNNAMSPYYDYTVQPNQGYNYTLIPYRMDGVNGPQPTIYAGMPNVPTNVGYNVIDVSGIVMYYCFDLYTVDAFTNLILDYNSNTGAYDTSINMYSMLDTSNNFIGSSCLTFNSSLQQYFNLPSFQSTTNGLTIAFWFKYYNCNQSVKLIDLNNVSGTDNIVIELPIESGFINTSIYNNGIRFTNQFNTQMILNNGTWNHLVWVINPYDYGKLYVNSSPLTPYSKSVPANAGNGYSMITINLNGTGYSRYTLNVTLPYNASFMASDFSNLAFYDGNAGIQLNYYIESVINEVSAVVWIYIPIITNNQVIYVVGGYTNQSNPQNVFLIYDTFQTLNPELWYIDTQNYTIGPNGLQFTNNNFIISNLLGPYSRNLNLVENLTVEAYVASSSPNNFTSLIMESQGQAYPTSTTGMSANFDSRGARYCYFGAYANTVYGYSANSNTSGTNTYYSKIGKTMTTDLSFHKLTMSYFGTNVSTYAVNSYVDGVQNLPTAYNNGFYTDSNRNAIGIKNFNIVNNTVANNLTIKWIRAYANPGYYAGVTYKIIQQASPLNYPTPIVRSNSTVGFSNLPNSAYMNGSIDELRVYNRTINTSEATALYRFPGNSPVIQNAYASNITTSSLDINFAGCYNTISISRNGVQIVSTTYGATTPYTDTGLNASTIYQYSILPYDSNGNTGTPYTFIVETQGNLYSLINYNFTLPTIADNSIVKYSNLSVYQKQQFFWTASGDIYLMNNYWEQMSTKVGYNIFATPIPYNATENYNIQNIAYSGLSMYYNTTSFTITTPTNSLYQYTNGNYTITCSSMYNNSTNVISYAPFNIFNANPVSPLGWYWMSYQNYNTYATTSAAVTSTNIGNIRGEWVQITFPYSFTLTNYSILSNNDGYDIQNFYIVGSFSGVGNWTVVDYKINVVRSNITPVSFTPSSLYPATPFNTFRLIVTAVYGGNYARIVQWNMNGIYNAITKSAYGYAIPYPIQNQAISFNGLSTMSQIVTANVPGCYTLSFYAMTPLSSNISNALNFALNGNVFYTLNENMTGNWVLYSGITNITTPGNYTLSIQGTNVYGLVGLSTIIFTPSILAIPTVALFTSNTLTVTNQNGPNYYKNGTYIVSTSNSYSSGYAGYNAFNGNFTNKYYRPGYASFTGYSSTLTAGNYSIFVYTSSVANAINFYGNVTLYVLSVGGGGSGGCDQAGGGGGGGVVQSTINVNDNDNISIVIGNGGVATSSPNYSYPGQNTTFTFANNYLDNSSYNMVAYGGGGGGSYAQAAGNGASGGGCGYVNYTTPGTGINGQGFAGGVGNGAGGGGANGLGNNPTITTFSTSTTNLVTVNENGQLTISNVTSIVSAIYVVSPNTTISNDNGRDVTSLMTSFISNGTININVNNGTMGGDPAPGAGKWLYMTYVSTIVTPNNSKSGNGGNGIQCTLPGISSSYLGGYYWGGGGGGGNSGWYNNTPGGSGGPGGNGGLGGGGGGSSNNFSGGSGDTNCFNAAGSGSQGVFAPAGNGGAGGVNTGGGGGGSAQGSGALGGAGGSGIVIVAILTQDVSGALYWQGTSSNYWLTNSAYAVNTGNYIGTMQTILQNYSPVNGEWLQIKMPYQIYLTSYSMTCRTGDTVSKNPRQFFLTGSNDGIRYYYLDYQNPTAWTNPISFTPINAITDAYNIYRVVVTQSNDTINGYVSIEQFNIYGNPVIVGNIYTVSATPTTNSMLLTISGNYNFTSVYRNNALIGNTITKTYTDTSLNSAVTYNYTLTPFDIYNISGVSFSVSGTTLYTPTTGPPILNNVNYTIVDPRGLAVYCPFDISTSYGNNIYNYASGYPSNITGSLINSPTINIVTPIVGTGSLVLDGSSQYVTVPSFTSNYDGITIAFWFKTNSTTIGNSSQIYLCSLNASTSTTGATGYVANISIQMNSSYYLTFYVANSDVGSYALNNWIPYSVPMNDSVWRHIAFVIRYDTYDGALSTYYSLYVNGAIVSTPYTVTGAYSYPYALTRNYNYVGYDPYANVYANCSFDEFRIYTRFLNNLEITDLYNYPSIRIATNITPYNMISPSNLLFHYPFDLSNNNGLNLYNYATGLPISDASLSSVSMLTGNYSISNSRFGNGCICFSPNFIPGANVTLGQYININKTFTITNNGLTFAFWFNSSNSGSYSSWHRVFDFGNGPNNNNISIYLNTNSYFYLYLYNGTSAVTNTNNTSFSGFNSNYWNHFVWTIAPSGTWTTYINGTLSDVWNNTYPSLVSRSQNNIGKSGYSSWCGNDASMNGMMKDFRFYNRVITYDEIKTLSFYPVSYVPENLYNVIDPSGLNIYMPCYYNNYNADFSTGNPFNITTYLNPSTIVNSKLTKTASLNLANNYYSISQYILNDLSYGTIAFWVYLNSFGYYTLFSKCDTNNNVFGLLSIGCYSNTNGTFQIGLSGGIYWQGYNAYAASAPSTNILNIYTWSHVAVVFSVSGCSIYVNGSLNNTTNGNYSIPYNMSTVNSYMGYWLKNNNAQQGNTFNGYVSDLRLYSRNLTNNEISTLYNYYQYVYTYVKPSSATILSSSITMNSQYVTINYSGYFTTLQITKNGNSIAGPFNSPFIDPSVNIGSSYTYVLTPYDNSGNPGTSQTLTTTIARLTGESYNIVSPTSLMYYSPLTLSSVNATGQLAKNYFNGSPSILYSGYINSPSGIVGNNYVIGNSSLFVSNLNLANKNPLTWTSLYFNTGATTVAFWCYILPTSGTTFLFSLYQNNAYISQTNGYQLSFNGTNINVVPFFNTWIHIAAVFNAWDSFGIAYINGVNTGLFNNGYFGYGSNTFTELSSYSSLGSNYNITQITSGFFQDLRIYSRPLTSSEILNIYNFTMLNNLPAITNINASSPSPKMALLNILGASNITNYTVSRNGVPISTVTYDNSFSSINFTDVNLVENQTYTYSVTPYYKNIAGNTVTVPYTFTPIVGYDVIDPSGLLFYYPLQSTNISKVTNVVAATKSTYTLAYSSSFLNGIYDQFFLYDINNGTVVPISYGNTTSTYRLLTKYNISNSIYRNLRNIYYVGMWVGQYNNNNGYCLNDTTITINKTSYHYWPYTFNLQLNSSLAFWFYPVQNNNGWGAAVSSIYQQNNYWVSLTINTPATTTATQYYTNTVYNCATGVPNYSDYLTLSSLFCDISNGMAVVGGNSYYFYNNDSILNNYNTTLNNTVFYNFYGNNMSVSMWFYWTATSQMYVDAYIAVVAGMTFYISYSTQRLCYCGNDTGYYLTLNTWYHIVGTSSNINNGRYAIYVNGTQIWSTNGYVINSTPTAMNSITPLFGSYTGMGNAIYGYFNDMRVYNRELTTNEIFTLYGYTNVNTQLIGNVYLNFVSASSIYLSISGQTTSSVSIIRNGNTIASGNYINYIDTNLAPNTTYNYNFIPFNLYGISGPMSKTFTYTTLSGCPEYNIVDTSALFMYYTFEPSTITTKRVTTTYPVDSMILYNMNKGTLVPIDYTTAYSYGFAYNNNNGGMLISPNNYRVGKYAIFNNVSTNSGIYCYHPFVLQNYSGLSVTVWIYLNTSISNTMILYFSNIGWQINISSNLLSSSFGTSNYYVPYNTWVHIAVVWDRPNSKYYMYANGNQVYSGNDTNMQPGRNVTMNLGNPFGGYMDEFRMYGRALSQQEVVAIYNYPNNSCYMGAYTSGATTNSLQLNFYGNYSSMTISRNNVIIATNVLTPYIDTGLKPTTVYSYVITPYDVSGNAGTLAIAYGTTATSKVVTGITAPMYNFGQYIPNNTTGISVVNAYIQNLSFYPNDIYNPKYGYQGVVCTTGLIYWIKGYLNPIGINPNNPPMQNIPYGITWDVAPTAINDQNYRYYTGIALTSDAKKFVVCSTTYCYFSVFVNFYNSWWYGPTVQTLDTVPRNYSGICTIGSGNRIMVCVNGDYIYYATWIPTDSGGNYTQFYRTSESVQRNYSAIACTDDGTKLVYCVNPGYVYYSTWNGNNYNVGSQIISNSIYNCNGIQFSPDGQSILLGVYNPNETLSGYTRYNLYNTDLLVATYNSSISAYNSFTTLATNLVNCNYNYLTNAFALSKDGMFLFIIPYYNQYAANFGYIQYGVNYGYYINTNQPAPVLYTSGIGGFTGTSITLVFTGVFNYVTITRNGVLIVPNPSNSPYVDINLIGNTTYNYVITPYNLNGVAGPSSPILTQQTLANVISINAGQTTNNVSLLYNGYFVYVTIMRNGYFITNYYTLSQYNDVNLPVDTNYTYIVTPYNEYNQPGLPISINTSTLPIINQSSVTYNIGVTVTLYYPGDFGYVTITYNGTQYLPNPTTNTTTITDLAYNTFYTFVITPYSLNQVKGFSFVSTAYTDSKLNTYSISNIGTTFIYVNFTGIFSYVVISQDGINYPRQITISPFRGITNLIPNTTYNYVVTTYNINGVPGQYSPTLTIVTLPLITSCVLGTITTSTINVNLTGNFLYLIYTYYAAPYNFPALGLIWNSYNGYHNGNVYYPITAPTNPGYIGVSQGITSDFTNLSTATNNNWVQNSGQVNFTILWFGYLYTQNYNGNWLFTISSDDQTFIWIGKNALSGYTTSNTNATVSGVQFFTLALLSYTYYPIRILYGQGSGAYNLSINIAPPGGQAFTNGNGYYFDSSGTTIQLANNVNTIVTSGAQPDAYNYTYYITPYNSANVPGAPVVISTHTLPYLSSAYFGTIGGTNVQLYFPGNFAYVQIFRNGSLITPYPTSSPYLDTQAIPNRRTTYVITAFNQENRSGNTFQITTTTLANVIGSYSSTTSSITVNYPGLFTFVTFSFDGVYISPNPTFIYTQTYGNLLANTAHNVVVTPYNISTPTLSGFSIYRNSVYLTNS
jgi:hypothetical protein